MKTAIVYYSLEGNTKFVAEKMAAELGADLIRLVPVKEYPTGNVSKYFWGGKSAVFREHPKLEPYHLQTEEYELVIIGSPIWASTYAPPLRTFLRDHSLRNKKIAIYACCSGGTADKYFAQVKEESKATEVMATARFVDPLKNAGEELDRKIKQFCDKLGRV